MYQLAKSKPQALLYGSFSFLLLIYCVYGAITGNLIVPGRQGELILSGEGAWLVCLSPVLLLVSDLVKFYPGLSVSLSTRSALATVLKLIAAGIFFYVMMYKVG